MLQMHDLMMTTMIILKLTLLNLTSSANPLHVHPADFSLFCVAVWANKRNRDKFTVNRNTVK